MTVRWCINVIGGSLAENNSNILSWKVFECQRKRDGHLLTQPSDTSLWKYLHRQSDISTWPVSVGSNQYHRSRDAMQNNGTDTVGVTISMFLHAFKHQWGDPCNSTPVSHKNTNVPAGNERRAEQDVLFSLMRFPEDIKSTFRSWFTGAFIKRTDVQRTDTHSKLKREIKHNCPFYVWWATYTTNTDIQ